MATQEVSHRMVRNRNGRKYLFIRFNERGRDRVEQKGEIVM